MRLSLPLWLRLLIGWAAIAGSGAWANTNPPALFGFTNLWKIHLTIPPEDWQTLGSRGVVQRNSNAGGGEPRGGLWEGLLRGIWGGDSSTASEEESSRYPWAQCEVEASGQRLTNVAVRLKGVSSVARAPNGYKRPLKLDFNRHVKGRRWLGVEEVYLNNNVNDATQMREALAYELFRRAGLPAPRTAFAQVYLTIPGETQRQHLGLYTLVEVVEGDFLERSFGAKKGLLMKPEMMRGLPYLGDDWRSYPPKYRPKDPASPTNAARVIQAVKFIREASPEQFGGGLSNYLDPDALLRFVALNALLANVDSFIGNGHNYYLYLHPDSRRLHFIPWDLNEAFGMHPVSGPSHYQMQTSILRPTADPNLLVERCLNDPKLGPAYREICAQMLTNLFVPARLAADIDRLASITQPVVFAESKRARADFERTVLGTLAPDEGDTSQPRFDSEYAKLRHRPWKFPSEVEIDNLPLKEWIQGRHAHALDQLAGKVKGLRPRARLY